MKDVVAQNTLGAPTLSRQEQLLGRADSVRLPTNREMFDGGASYPNSSDFLESLDADGDFASRITLGSQVANYFVDNILGRMNSINSNNQMFSTTLAPELFETVFGKNGGALTLNSPSNGLMGEWRLARTTAERTNINPRAALSESLAENHTHAELSKILSNLEAISSARATFLSASSSTTTLGQELSSTEPYPALNPTTVFGRNSFAAGNSFLPPAPRLGQDYNISVNQENSWKSIFEAAPVVVIPTTRDVLNDPQQYLKKGQQFYNPAGQLQVVDGTNPIETLNSLAKTLGLPEVPSELYREKFNKIVKITGTASHQEIYDSLDFGSNGESSALNEGRYPVALEYELAREIANQMGVPYSDVKKNGGENQLKGTITISNSDKEFPIVVDRVVSTFGMRNWQHIVARSLNSNDGVDISNTTKSRIVEIQGSLADQIPELRNNGTAKVTIALSADNDPKSISPELALKNIGTFYRSLAS